MSRRYVFGAQSVGFVAAAVVTMIPANVVFAAPGEKPAEPQKVAAPAAAATPAATKDAAADKGAENKNAEKKKDEVVKTGVVASSGTMGNVGAVNAQTSNDAPGDENSVISGSISRSGSDNCTAKIVNSGEKEYSVSFSVEGRNAQGSKVFDRYFSGTVKPKQTLEKLVTGCNPSLNLAVNLKSARALGK